MLANLSGNFTTVNYVFDSQTESLSNSSHDMIENNDVFDKGSLPMLPQEIIIKVGLILGLASIKHLSNLSRVDKKTWYIIGKYVWKDLARFFGCPVGQNPQNSFKNIKIEFSSNDKWVGVYKYATLDLGKKTISIHCQSTFCENATEIFKKCIPLGYYIEYRDFQYYNQEAILIFRSEKEEVVKLKTFDFVGKEDKEKAKLWLKIKMRDKKFKVKFKDIEFEYNISRILRIFGNHGEARRMLVKIRNVAHSKYNFLKEF